MNSEPIKGKLYPKNVVSTYFTRNANDYEQCEMNLPAVAMVTQGKYGRGVFPAVVSKARIPVSGVDPIVPPASMTYPLQKKRKSAPGEDDGNDDGGLVVKSSSSSSSKKLKSVLRDSGQPQFITATDSLFKSGQNVVAGGTSVEANKLIAYMHIRRLSNDLDVDLRIYNIKTQNIVCSTDIGFEINCEWISQEADRRGWEVYYCPEEFIGLSWVIDVCVFVVFNTGKIVATGLKAMEQIPIAEKRMHELIAPFRKGNEPAHFDRDHAHMRDTETLNQIKSTIPVLGGIGANKENAAKRNRKKLLNEIKMMMKTLDVQEASDDDFLSLLIPLATVEDDPM